MRAVTVNVYGNPKFTHRALVIPSCPDGTCHGRGMFWTSSALRPKSPTSLTDSSPVRLCDPHPSIRSLL